MPDSADSSGQISPVIELFSSHESWLPLFVLFSRSLFFPPDVEFHCKKSHNPRGRYAESTSPRVKFPLLVCCLVELKHDDTRFLLTRVSRNSVALFCLSPQPHSCMLRSAMTTLHSINAAHRNTNKCKTKQSFNAVPAQNPASGRGGGGALE